MRSIRDLTSLALAILTLTVLARFPKMKEPYVILVAALAGLVLSRMGNLL